MGTNERFHSLAPSRVQGANGGFRQRCASALTRPVTVAALAVLLLNDVLFKSLWPESWVTGKLSDLAWMVFAPPLLAFLLSFLTRWIPRVERASWLAAYVGLPLLYAAFNTFEPVHYWILQGLSVASGGTAGSPLDVTDSLVIPFGWVIAIWVWRQRVVGPATQRLRWGLLVAGVAALASVATSESPTDPGITKLGVSTDGTVHAIGSYGGRYQSRDGGLNWTGASTDPEGIEWGGDSAETPRGRYAVMGPYILLFRIGQLSERVYSTEYLLKPGNVWIQKHESNLDHASEVATRPLGIIYDARSGNLIVAMGRQGVVVGTPDGRWERIAVGGYAPTDFSFTAKTRLLLSRLDFWALAVVLSLAMMSAALTYLQRDAGDPRPLAFTRQTVLVLLIVVTAALLAGFYFIPNLIGVTGLWALLLFLAPILVGVALGILPRQSKFRRILPISILALFAVAPAIVLSGYLLGPGFIGLAGFWVLLIIPGPILAGIAVDAMPRQSELRKILLFLMGVLSLVASGALLLVFGGSADDSSFYGLYFGALSVPAFMLGIAALTASWRQLRHWREVIASFAGMLVLVLLSFMLWLHLGVSLALAKTSAVVLTGLTAYVLVGYVRRKAARIGFLCPNCRQSNSLLAKDCYNCGLSLSRDTETR